MIEEAGDEGGVEGVVEVAEEAAEERRSGGGISRGGCERTQREVGRE